MNSPNTKAFAKQQAKDLAKHQALEFLGNTLELDQTAYPIRTSYLYELYEKHTHSTGGVPLGAMLFGKALNEKFPRAEKVRRGPKTSRVNAYIYIRYKDGVIPEEKFWDAYADDWGVMSVYDRLNNKLKNRTKIPPKQ